MKCPLCADDDATLERVWTRIQDAKTRGDESPYFKNAPSWFLESLEDLPEATDYSLYELEKHLIEIHMMTNEDAHARAIKVQA